jgi:precorrin-2 dehydrogenase/sirohydrochlorin ferrochelatase
VKEAKGVRQMGYYPVFLDVHDKKALVIGGGLVAERKVETLLDYGASVFIVSRELTSRLKELVEEKKIQYAGPEFHENRLEEIFLVIAATDDAMLNHRVSLSAQERGLLINAVDQPEDCNFIVPSIVRRGDLQVAISTSGKSPALARKIREEMELRFGEEYEKLLLVMGIIREMILSRGLPQEQNKRIFEKIIESDILDAISGKDRERIETILKSALGNEFEWIPVLERVLGSEGE